MTIINLKQVMDYINGLDIDGDLEELENDPSFMLHVLKVSKDPKMYNLCSDTVKKNYNFVLDVINYFSDIDFSFVKLVAGNYLDSLKLGKQESKETLEEFLNRIRHMEIDILVSSKKDEVNRFTVSRALAVSKEDSVINYLHQEGMKGLELGFILIIDKYASSKIITDFFAQRFVNNIFYRNGNDNFEEFVHRNCKDPNLIFNGSYKGFILNIIAQYDSYLFYYLQGNNSLLLSLKDDLNKVLDNWDNYMTGLNKKRVEAFEDIVFDYLSVNDRYAFVSCDALVKYTAETLKIRDVFLKYDSYYDDSVDIDFLYDDSNPIIRNSKRFALNTCKKLFEKDVVDRAEYLSEKRKASNVINIKDVRANSSK